MKLSKQAWIALGITSVGLTGCTENKETPNEAPPKAASVRDITLTREQIDKMLQEIAKQPLRAQYNIGACCYDMALPPERLDYLCPVCNTKTLHKKNVFSVAYAQRLRPQIQRLKELGLDITLDEADLCSQCRHDKTTDTIEFHIDVRLNNHTTRTLLTEDDLAKLVAFFEKKDAWRGSRDREYPLQPELPRIRKILGMETNSKEKQ